jgi:gamma-glutamylcyclotransferase (GGCT)/AIG2-like uncharacterized protein YtfP
MAEDALPLFAYATLAEESTLERLLGRHGHRILTTAELPDHEKVWARGFGYPYVVARPGSRVVGRLIEGLSSSDYLRLDEYEGLAEGDYRRVRVRVRPHGVGRREPVDAYAYTLGPRWERLAGEPS